MIGIGPTDVRWTGALLVAGMVLFLTGAAFWRMRFQQRDLQKVLFAVAGSQGQWTWIHSWMIVGVVTTTTAVALLRDLLVIRGDRIFSTMAATGYTLGAVLMLGTLTFGLTVVRWAADETKRTGAMPSWFPALQRWGGTMYVVHMLLSYLAFIPLGISLLETGLVAPWAAWSTIGIGAISAIGFAALGGGPFAPPILAHVPTAAIGILLLI